MTHVVPPELWDGIIDYLHDRSTLGKCGLVCRFWLWSSRSHLFSTLVLASFDIDTAIDLLCTPGSTTPPHVRTLEMEEGMVREFDPPWVSKTLPKLPQLNAVERLSISRVQWDILMPEAKDPLFTILHRLKSLTVHDMEFKTLGQVLQFISPAQSLEYLSLGLTHVQIPDTPLAKFRAPPIKQVVFRWNQYTPVIIDWLCLWQPSPSVRNLTFDGIDVAKIPSISAYIRRRGPVLEHLELGCSRFGDHGETPATLRKEIDFTQNTSLKTIAIDNLILYSDSPGSHTYDWIIDILSRITSRFIERVTLIVFLNTPQELVFLDLPALAAFFSHGSPTFAERSTRLRFIIYGGVDRTEARTAIAESLRELDSQGRLEFALHRIDSASMA